MPIIFYSKDTQFEVTQKELNACLQNWNLGRSTYITRLNCSLSPHYIWAGDKPANKNRGRLHDGTIVVRDKYGKWVDERNPEIKLDIHYYPELANDEVEIVTGKEVINT